MYLKQRWDALPKSARSILPPFLILGGLGSIIIGFDLIRSSYLSREVPKREQTVRAFLANPRNYEEKLEGVLDAFTLQQSFSDTFATYTIFYGKGIVRGKDVLFRARVLRYGVEVDTIK